MLGISLGSIVHQANTGNDCLATVRSKYPHYVEGKLRRLSKKVSLNYDHITTHCCLIGVVTTATETATTIY